MANMENLFAVCALAMVCAVLYAAVRRVRPDHALAISAICSVMILISAVKLLTPILAFFRNLQDLSGLNAALTAPVLKTVAIGLLTQLAGSFCQDAGEQSLAKSVEVSGMLLAFYTALPLASQVLRLLQELMGG